MAYKLQRIKRRKLAAKSLAGSNGESNIERKWRNRMASMWRKMLAINEMWLSANPACGAIMKCNQ